MRTTWADVVGCSTCEYCEGCEWREAKAAEAINKYDRDAKDKLHSQVRS
jgi:hypothetical protein